MGSGLIYAALVVMWAVYFIPRWLRRHEELSEARSVERFDRAMRILSRREPTPDKRYVVMPPRPEGAPVPAQRVRGGLRTRSRATVRRRRVLAVLLLTLLVTSVLAPLTGLRWWAPLLALVAVVGYLAHCRLQARTRRQVDRTREAVRKSYRSRFLRFDAIERLMTVRRELAAERAAEEARWQEAEEAMRREEEAERARRAAADAAWSPVPVPLPTYVTKPPAPRRAPAIDLTNPGAWTEAQVAAAAVEPAPQAAGARPASPMSALLHDADSAGDDLDAIIERRAVND